jgi:hypothetical protein
VSEEKEPSVGKLIELLAHAVEAMNEKHGEIVDVAHVNFPVTVQNLNRTVQRVTSDAGIGTLVRVRPATDDPNERTHLGIYLGDMIFDVTVAYSAKSSEMFVSDQRNPAIFVPKLRKIVWGIESWWSAIKTPEEVEKQITDDDIANIPYVKVLKELLESSVKDEADAVPPDSV